MIQYQQILVSGDDALGITGERQGQKFVVIRVTTDLDLFDGRKPLCRAPQAIQPGFEPSRGPIPVKFWQRGAGDQFGKCFVGKQQYCRHFGKVVHHFSRNAGINQQETDEHIGIDDDSMLC